MAKVETFTCDICGAYKKEANHWFKAYKLLLGGVIVIPWDCQPASNDIESLEAHLCGADCVTRWLSTNLL